jgi:hypothetical protein
MLCGINFLFILRLQAFSTKVIYFNHKSAEIPRSKRSRTPCVKLFSPTLEILDRQAHWGAQILVTFPRFNNVILFFSPAFSNQRNFPKWRTHPENPNSVNSF